MFQRYQTARVASYSLAHFPKGKVSKKALLEILTDPARVDKVDFAFPEGRPYFGFKDLAKNGGHELHVRINGDRDVAVVPVQATWKKLQVAIANARKNLEPTIADKDYSLEGRLADALAPTICKEK